MFNFILSLQYFHHSFLNLRLGLLRNTNTILALGEKLLRKMWTYILGATIIFRPTLNGPPTHILPLVINFTLQENFVLSPSIFIEVTESEKKIDPGSRQLSKKPCILGARHCTICVQKHCSAKAIHFKLCVYISEDCGQLPSYF